ncbi:hypothetical protein HZS_2721 [Henneguya salminicola]|uniref:Large ribosomal subunit protein eL22 n=1 Tax=Henneguya salminicola TaxID=69463 RepID=A0A6G3ML46_HENSL|nr:hypothetical protein HZS_2721 [Henneguya salminicola]
MVIVHAKSTKNVQPKKTKTTRYCIDCTRCVEDKIIHLPDFVDFLKTRIKVNGKINNLGSNVVITASTGKITVSSNIPISKRSLKYFSKKFLKRRQLRDWVRVISSSKNGYELRYFHIASDAEDEAQE